MLFANYVLGPSQGNVGSTYQQYYWNPLQAAATAQEFFDCLPGSVAFGWLPRPVYSGVATTFTAVVSGGLEPFTYSWTFGDGDGASGSSVVHALIPNRDGFRDDELAFAASCAEAARSLA